jgi:hypothetical protein
MATNKTRDEYVMMYWFVIGIALIIIWTSVCIGLLVMAYGQEPDDILPQFPQERIPCYTANEYDFSPYRCYMT